MGDNTGDRLAAVARSLRRHYGSALGAWEIAPSQARALRLVCEREAPRVSALAEGMRIAPRSATELVDALEDRGLVAREADPSDRRATCVVPTEAGRALHAEIEQTRADAAADFLARLSTEDRAHLDRILAQLLEP